MSQYAGAEWIETVTKREMSELGIAAANLLGDVFQGIYHIDTKQLRQVDWGNPTNVWVPINTSLCTVDFDHLTRLVVLAHDRMIRVEIRGKYIGWLMLVFHQRKSRMGERWARYETLEDHVALLRGHYGQAEP